MAKSGKIYNVVIYTPCTLYRAPSPRLPLPPAVPHWAVCIAQLCTAHCPGDTAMAAANPSAGGGGNIILKVSILQEIFFRLPPAQVTLVVK